MAVEDRRVRIVGGTVVDETGQFRTRMLFGATMLGLILAGWGGLTWWRSGSGSASTTIPRPIETSGAAARSSASTVQGISTAVSAGIDGTQGAKADQPFIDALRAEFAKKTLPAESPGAALDQLSKDKDKREAHNQNILNRVSVAAVPTRATNPSDALRQTLHSLVEASTAGATPAAGDAAFVAALRPEARTRENETRTIVVQSGDTLSAIAQRAYGDPAKFMKIFEANPRVLTSPHQLFIGMVLRVPA